VRELLAYLAVHPSGRRREELSADLWPDAQPGQDVTLMHTTLHRLRQALYPELVPSEGPATEVYRIHPQVPLDVDVLRFERLLQAAQGSAVPAAQRRTLLMDAVAAYDGPFFPECYAGWAVAVRQRLERRYTIALAQLADVAWAEGDYRSCLAWCERLLDLGLADASVHCRALECYERLGEPLAGILFYRRYALAGCEPNGGSPSSPAAAILRRLEAAAAR
jgi:DNA-binding SARP family transcriptional activator